MSPLTPSLHIPFSFLSLTYLPPLNGESWKDESEGKDILYSFLYLLLSIILVLPFLSISFSLFPLNHVFACYLMPFLLIFSIGIL